MRRRTGWPVVAGLALVACGGGDGGAAGLGDDPTIEECGDALAAATADIDIEGIDATGGLNDEEHALLEERIDALVEEHPVLADDGGPCASAFGEATPEEFQAAIADVDPAALAVLSAPRSFDQVSDTIGPN